VKEYVNSRNEEQSAVKAGIAPQFAKKVAEGWLRLPEVLEFMHEVVKKTPDEKINRDWLLNEAKNTYINAQKATDKATLIRLMHDIVTQTEKLGGAEDAQPTINIYTDKDINIL
jgi:phage terminase small subunit